MSNQITEAFVQQFSSNIFHLAQQKGSRLRAAVRNEMQRGKQAFYERLGATAAIERTGRHQDTPLIETPHSRRAVSLVDYEVADLIDDQDRIRTLINPDSPYAQAMMFALGRAMDDKIITAMQGNAFSGEDGSTSVALPDSQKLLSFTGSGPVTVATLNLDALRKAKEVLDAAEVDPMHRRYCALNARQLRSLLEETEVTSSDFNTVKALVRGEIDEFMGFTFIRTERIPQADADYVAATGLIDAGTNDTTESNADHVLCWAEAGVLLSIGKDMKARISERDDKSYATQVYACMSIGATRLEEEFVVDIACSNS